MSLLTATPASLREALRAGADRGSVGVAINIGLPTEPVIGSAEKLNECQRPKSICVNRSLSRHSEAAADSSAVGSSFAG